MVLAACCDIHPAAAEYACREYGFQRFYTDYIEMVEKEKPDVVLAVTPVELTKEISIQLLERKIPVLLEKPPGMDPEENIAIHDAAIRNNTPARVAFNRRYTPLLRALMEEMKAAQVPVIDVSCMFIRIGRKSTDFSTTAIHGIDTVRFLSGSDYAKVHLHYHDCLIEQYSLFESNGYYVECQIFFE